MISRWLLKRCLYCNAPVVGAPSGLAIGGGYEVLAHCDHVVAHTNSVMGLVETVVGVVPGGGGVKETYLRWYKRTGIWEEAAFKTFNQIGYGQTGTSPDLAAELAYFEPDRDTQVMNRDRLVEAALGAIGETAQGLQAARKTANLPLPAVKPISGRWNCLKRAGKRAGSSPMM